MPALLHFDFEFSHPVPGIGRPMQIGCSAHAFNPDTLESNGKTRSFQAKFHVDADAIVTPWVKEKQSELLKTCQQMTGADTRKSVLELRDYLRVLKQEFGDPISPCGWCIGSDLAYLLYLLGEENELVHYSAVDLKGVAIALTGQYDPGDKEFAKLVGVDPISEEDEHDALKDAQYQGRLLRAAFKLVRSRVKS